MRRTKIAIVIISLFMCFFSIYIGQYGLHNVAYIEHINQMFTEDEEIDLEELYYYHESIKEVSGSISKVTWIITVLALINTGLAFYGFFKSKNIIKSN